jgi:hypothetical protein
MPLKIKPRRPRRPSPSTGPFRPPGPSCRWCGRPTRGLIVFETPPSLRLALGVADSDGSYLIFEMCRDCYGRFEAGIGPARVAEPELLN